MTNKAMQKFACETVKGMPNFSICLACDTFQKRKEKRKKRGKKGNENKILNASALDYYGKK